MSVRVCHVTDDDTVNMAARWTDRPSARPNGSIISVQSAMLVTITTARGRDETPERLAMAVCR